MLSIFISGIWEAEASGSLWIQGQPRLQRKFCDSQYYTARLSYKKLNWIKTVA